MGYVPPPSPFPSGSPSKRAGRICLFVVLALVALMVAGGFRGYRHDVAMECVRVEPREVVARRIRVEGGGLFGSGVLTYQLGDAGRRKGSGESCSVWRLVTESEYERHGCKP